MVFLNSANCQIKELKDLQTPNSPGFILADKAPSSVEKPTNPRTFGVSLFNLREGGALEVTPFWLFNQAKYTQESFVKPIPILSTFNLSTATFKTDSSSAFSIGYKSHIVRLFSKVVKKNLKQLEIDGATISGIATLDSLQIVNLNDSQLILLGGASYKLMSNSEKEKIIKKAIDSLKERINVARVKPFFQTELAGAYLGESKNNSFKKLSATKAGFWLNFHFKPEKFPLDILVLTRYSWNIGESEKLAKDSAYFDFGLGLSFENKKFDLHLEYVNRQDIIFHQNYNRLVFVMNYQILDEVTLVGSFGKNFDNVNNIFTVIGTKIGISKAKLKL